MDRFLKSSAVLRIIALVMACTIWLGVNAPNSGGGGGVSSGMTERFAYPVNVQVASDMVVTQIDTPTAEVAVKSDTLLVTSLPAAMMNVSVSADARGLAAGKHVLPLSATHMPKVQYDIEPVSVTVNIERKTSVQKSVRVNVQGNPHTGFTVGTAVTDVDAVQVTGVNQTVQSVNAVVANVSIEGATQSVTKVVNLLPVDKQGKAVPGVELNPVTVTVSIPIHPPQVTANVVPQIIGSPAPGYAVAGVDVKPATVVVDGSSTVTGNIQNINLPIDVTGFRDTKTLHVKLPLPAGATKLEPSTVDATVTMEPSASKSFTGISIQVDNAPKGEQVKLTGAQMVDITVLGPASIVNALGTSQIRVYIDASKLTAGSTSAQVQVSTPDWVRVTSITDRSVPVQVVQS